MKIELGSTVIDKITGFKGIAIGRCQYISSCDTYLVSHKFDKLTGTKVSNEWFDVNRLEVLPLDVIKIDTSEDNGSMEAPPTKYLQPE